MGFFQNNQSFVCLKFFDCLNIDELEAVRSVNFFSAVYLKIIFCSNLGKRVQACQCLL